MNANGRGYVVVEHGSLDLRTVYPTRRGAIVNWLMTHGQSIAASTSDGEIEELWAAHYRAHGEISVHMCLVVVES
jgi:hypothetical protein